MESSQDILISHSVFSAPSVNLEASTVFLPVGKVDDIDPTGTFGLVCGSRPDDEHLFEDCEVSASEN